MKHLFISLGNFGPTTRWKIVLFNFFVLIFSPFAHGISLKFQDGVASETTDSYQIAHPNSEIRYFVPQQELTKEKPYHTIPSSSALPPSYPNYKYTLAYIGKQANLIHEKPEDNSNEYKSAAVVPTTSGNYVKLSNSIPHYVQEEAKQYKYGYRVRDPHKGAEFGHSETHDGHTVKGYYHVLLPDGRLQSVAYWAGPSGYHASVTYDGKHY